MKTQLKLKGKNALKFMGIVFMIGLFFTTATISAQTIDQEVTDLEQEMTVEGLVSNVDGPLPGVNIVLKGTRTGTVSNIDGKFTFPKALKAGDILLFSYLGYETQEIKINRESSYINMMLTVDSVTIIEALNTDVPYKSKRN